MKVKAVIGAQYGDEGKGLVTDYLSNANTLVVRYNGGAQAGHTVVTPSGDRHVFHHVGAGTLRGARTLLARHFIVNPAVFRSEFDSLNGLAGSKIVVDHRCRVTTPWDMWLNQLVEEKRGAARHGTCGLGINETVERNNRGYVLTAFDCTEADYYDKLLWIRDEYIKLRAEELGVTIPPLALSERVFERFIDDTNYFTYVTQMVFDAAEFKRSTQVVFEGAQGLKLDEESSEFPHVTRSRTGLPYILELLQEANFDGVLDVFYVTRTYTTRHGAGLLLNELSSHPYSWSGPETNVENPGQGKFRYALLKHDDLRISIMTDLKHHAMETKTKFILRPRLAVTCVDQLTSENDFPALHDTLQQKVKLDITLVSSGPTRNDVGVLQRM